MSLLQLVGRGQRVMPSASYDPMTFELASQPMLDRHRFMSSRQGTSMSRPSVVPVDPVVEDLDLRNRHVEGGHITLPLAAEAMGACAPVSPCQLSTPVTLTPAPDQGAVAPFADVGPAQQPTLQLNAEPILEQATPPPLQSPGLETDTLALQQLASLVDQEPMLVREASAHVSTFINGVCVAAPAPVACTPVPRCKPRLPATEDGLLKRSARVAAQGRRRPSYRS
jgi:hypothetical protein